MLKMDSINRTKSKMILDSVAIYLVLFISSILNVNNYFKNTNF